MDLKELEDMPTFTPRVNVGNMDHKDAFIAQQLDILNQKMDWLGTHTILAFNLSVQTDKQLQALKRERWMVIGGGIVILFLFENFIRK